VIISSTPNAYQPSLLLTGGVRKSIFKKFWATYQAIPLLSAGLAGGGKSSGLGTFHF
jgi:hypothetical protein